MDRRDEVSLNLAETNERIDQACRAAGRTRDDVTLIAVTKTWPASDTELLADLGVTDVGENRDQDARIKHDELIDLRSRGMRLVRYKQIKRKALRHGLM